MKNSVTLGFATLGCAFMMASSAYSAVISEWRGHKLLSRYGNVDENPAAEAEKFCKALGYQALTDFKTERFGGYTLIQAWASDYHGKGMKLIDVSDSYELFSFIDCE